MLVTISETEEIKEGMLDDGVDFYVLEIRNEAPSSTSCLYPKCQ